MQPDECWWQLGNNRHTKIIPKFLQNFCIKIVFIFIFSRQKPNTSLTVSPAPTYTPHVQTKYSIEFFFPLSLCCAEFLSGIRRTPSNRIAFVSISILYSAHFQESLAIMQSKFIFHMQISFFSLLTTTHE